MLKMPYEDTHRLLSEQLDDVVLIESPFEETTRDGVTTRSVLLALTRNKFVVVARNKIRSNPSLYYNRIESQYNLNEVHLSIFKRTKKQVLKALFKNKVVKYFALASFNKRKIFWSLWCNHVKELNSSSKLWPFTDCTKYWRKHDARGESNNQDFLSCTCMDSCSRSLQSGPPEVGKFQKPSLRWTDKYLYLGSKREAEDNNRPSPVPGLGRTDDLRLLYLKSEYFGCWDQAEHWVQCGDSVLQTPRDSNVYTYTGEPTSNVTYTSLMTTWK